MAPAVGTFSDLVDIVIATEAYNSLEQRQSLSASVVQLTPRTVFQSDQGTCGPCKALQIRCLLVPEKGIGWS